MFCTGRQMFREWCTVSGGGGFPIKYDTSEKPIQLYNISTFALEGEDHVQSTLKYINCKILAYISQQNGLNCSIKYTALAFSKREEST